jgi:hypothetical protein
MSGILGIPGIFGNPGSCMWGRPGVLGSEGEGNAIFGKAIEGRLGIDIDDMEEDFFFLVMRVPAGRKAIDNGFSSMNEPKALIT